MFITHREMRHLIYQHYHINGAQCVDDLNERDQKQICVAVIQDGDYFDIYETLFYKPKTNFIHIFKHLIDKKIDEKQFVDQLFQIILDSSRSQINEIFDEFVDKEKIYQIINYTNVDSIDATRGFI